MKRCDKHDEENCWPCARDRMDSLPSFTPEWYDAMRDEELARVYGQPAPGWR